ncbi:hypothetical protein I302_106495 [Kwoniella bestiolae CBS 10118]|uniref:F-box domain-containing protein n=1 Tax=Kwoniella bestiolae CBS 10118 TaxID=1296100 RepID=A0A1B9G196_9TREE|nr:hypothetical protein I302_06247 [Kwoniella bestiolae CBS 10118]OCF24786.1 hypothetical protein I302_06247 [Kwoniella bestiolae CBS 10118]
MLSPPILNTEVVLQPSDQSLRPFITALPEDIRYYILSQFATLSFDHLKTVTQLNSTYYASFHSRLYRSITFTDQDAQVLRQLCIAGSTPESVAAQSLLQSLLEMQTCKDQYTRFRSLCASSANLTITGEKILEVISQILNQQSTTNLFPNLNQLVLKDMTSKHNPRRIRIDTPLEESLKTVLAHVHPQKLCLNLGIPFSHTWRNLIQNLAGKGLCGIKEVIHHGVPISNLEIEFLILEDVEVQRFFLEDYIIPSYSQRTLQVAYRWSSPGKPYTPRVMPKEIHIYAHWAGEYGLPLELVDSPIEYMGELREVTHVHQSDEKVGCVCSLSTNRTE